MGYIDLGYVVVLGTLAGYCLRLFYRYKKLSGVVSSPRSDVALAARDEFVPDKQADGALG
ncbi:MAG TPA: hypothetical protein VMU77_00670 [Acidimicrobiales bacterium]|nr:hypothetical protein [Acidimicrobiales bacterium]